MKFGTCVSFSRMFQLKMFQFPVSSIEQNTLCFIFLFKNRFCFHINYFGTIRNMKHAFSHFHSKKSWHPFSTFFFLHHYSIAYWAPCLTNKEYQMSILWRKTLSVSRFFSLVCMRKKQFQEIKFFAFSVCAFLHLSDNGINFKRSCIENLGV